MTAMRYKGKKQRGVAMIEMVMVTPLMLATGQMQKLVEVMKLSADA